LLIGDSQSIIITFVTTLL